MAPLLRILLRYGIGFFAAAGIVPDGLADMVVADPEAIAAIELGLCAGAGFCVETFYARAKKYGWSL